MRCLRTLLRLSEVSIVQADASSCGEIQRRYADHLYSKHDYDGAMTQYVATIGYLEPSYVIRKFLDAQRIHNLTSYLEQLHEGVSFLTLLCHALLHTTVSSATF